MSNKNANTTAIRDDEPTLMNVLTETGINRQNTEVAPQQSNNAETKASDALKIAADEQIPLIKTDTALMSLRASNFDTPTAVENRSITRSRLDQITSRSA